MLILDIMMPGMDGYSLCREIRKSSEVPIIMISAKDDEIDKVLVWNSAVMITFPSLLVQRTCGKSQNHIQTGQGR